VERLNQLSAGIKKRPTKQEHAFGRLAINLCGLAHGCAYTMPGDYRVRLVFGIRIFCSLRAATGLTAVSGQGGKLVAAPVGTSPTGKKGRFRKAQISCKTIEAEWSSISQNLS
jgi:hypothetical protein